MYRWNIESLVNPINSYLRTGIFLLTFNIKDNFIQLKSEQYDCHTKINSFNTDCLRKIVVGHMLFAL